jgi:hypothetical protein
MWWCATVAIVVLRWVIIVDFGGAKHVFPVICCRVVMHLFVFAGLLPF